MTWTVMPTFDEYAQAREEFAWDLPEEFNPAVDFLRKHDDTSRTALQYEDPDAGLETYSFDDLDELSDRLAAALADLGVEAGVVGVPDETRGEAIKAYVRPASDDYDPDDLREEIRDLVRERLAEYEYPKHVAFVDELPTTTTGKIQRRSLRERAERADSSDE